MGGSWANRGLMCKVYKCTELDKEFTKKDAQWSIPGSSNVPGVTVMPSDQPLAREPIPFEVPQPDFEVPEGYDWCWQDNQLYQKGTFFRYDASGWLVNPRNKAYYDAYTGWRYDGDQQCLVDDATGKRYTMDRQEISYIGTVQCFPGQAAPYELPGLVEWDTERGAGFLPGTSFVYDPTSGWVIDFDSNVYYDAYSGYAYDPTQNNLVDMQTGKRYDMTTRQEIV